SVGPASVFAPYFVNDGTTEVKGLNLAMLRDATAVTAGDHAAMLAFDTRSLNPTAFQALAAEYVGSGTRRMFLWPTDLDEHYSSLEVLTAYADMVTLLSGAGVDLVASYGGFFAILLAFRGLAGITHGLTYGDKRVLEPVVRVGLPRARHAL